ncbi:hypothetical protein BJX76DRAFT_358827 [Aspergillus varians]
MQLFSSLRRPKAVFRHTPLDDNHEAIRCASRKALDDMFKELKNSAVHKLDDDDVKCLGIIPKSLDSHLTTTSFFKPFPIERMKQTPLDMNDEEIRLIIQAHRTRSEKIGPKDIDGGDLVYSTLCTQFSTFLRVDQDGNQVDSLAGQSEWHGYHIDDDVLLEKYEAFGALGKSKLVPWTTDIRSVDRRHDGNPHILLMMIQHTSPVEELLRTEILTLVGVIITRLGAQSLADHRVMPVMALSCFQNARARILQAFMTEAGLIIYKTKLYDFTDQENRDDAIEKCLSYMASTPIGDTKSLNYRLLPQDG